MSNLIPFVKLCNFLTNAFACCKTKLTLNLNFKSIVKTISCFFFLFVLSLKLTLDLINSETYLLEATGKSDETLS